MKNRKGRYAVIDVRCLHHHQRREEEQRQRELLQAEVLAGNPLTSGSSGTATIKRRWNDDVVFKNQARDEKKVEKRFINDTIRSDFHRRFMQTYIKWSRVITAVVTYTYSKYRLQTHRNLNYHTQLLTCNRGVGWQWYRNGSALWR